MVIRVIDEHKIRSEARRRRAISDEVLEFVYAQLLNETLSKTPRKPKAGKDSLEKN